jgi:hypothetical protein
MQLAVQPPAWLAPQLRNTIANFGDDCGLSLDNKTLLLQIDPGLDQEGFGGAAKTVHEWHTRVGNLGCLGSLWIAKIILEYSAKFEVEIEQAIDDLGMVANTDRSAETLLKWARTLKNLGEDCYIHGVNMTYLQTAASYAAPENPLQKHAFVRKRRKLLEILAVDRVKNRAWLIAEMVKLQQEYGVQKKTQAKGPSKVNRYAVCCYLLKYATDKQLEEKGTTRAEVASWALAYEAECVDESILGPIENISLPFITEGDKNGIPETNAFFDAIDRPEESSDEGG